MLLRNCQGLISGSLLRIWSSRKSNVNRIFLSASFCGRWNNGDDPRSSSRDGRPLLQPNQPSRIERKDVQTKGRVGVTCRFYTKSLEYPKEVNRRVPMNRLCAVSDPREHQRALFSCSTRNNCIEWIYSIARPRRCTYTRKMACLLGEGKGLRNERATCCSPS
jgi:hypothetical protein